MRGQRRAQFLLHAQVDILHQVKPADLIQAAADLSGAHVAALAIERRSGTFREEIILIADLDQLSQQSIHLLLVFRGKWFIKYILEHFQRLQGVHSLHHWNKVIQDFQFLNIHT